MNESPLQCATKWDENEARAVPPAVMKISGACRKKRLTDESGGYHCGLLSARALPPSPVLNLFQVQRIDRIGPVALRFHQCALQLFSGALAGAHQDKPAERQSDAGHEPGKTKGCAAQR